MFSIPTTRARLEGKKKSSREAAASRGVRVLISLLFL
jgi:hypothetical protein